MALWCFYLTGSWTPLQLLSHSACSEGKREKIRWKHECDRAASGLFSQRPSLQTPTTKPLPHKPNARLQKKKKKRQFLFCFFWGYLQFIAQSICQEHKRGIKIQAVLWYFCPGTKITIKNHSHHHTAVDWEKEMLSSHWNLILSSELSVIMFSWSKREV